MVCTPITASRLSSATGRVVPSPRCSRMRPVAMGAALRRAAVATIVGEDLDADDVGAGRGEPAEGPAGAEADLADLLTGRRVEQLDGGVVDGGGLADPDAGQQPADSAVRPGRLPGQIPADRHADGGAGAVLPGWSAGSRDGAGATA